MCRKGIRLIFLNRGKRRVSASSGATVDIFYGNIEFLLCHSTWNIKKSYLFFLKRSGRGAKRASSFRRRVWSACGVWLAFTSRLRRRLHAQAWSLPRSARNLSSAQEGSLCLLWREWRPFICLHLIYFNCSMKRKVKELFLPPLVHKSATGF